MAIFFTFIFRVIGFFFQLGLSLFTLFYDLFSQNFGLRMVRTWLLGIPVMVGVFFMMPHVSFNENRLTLSMQLMALLALYLFAVIPLKTVIRKRRAFGSLLFRLIGWANLAAIIYTFIQLFPPPDTGVYERLPEWLSSIANNEEAIQTARPAAIAFGISAVLCYGFPLAYFLRI